jgi:hypothetical protein
VPCHKPNSVGGRLATLIQLDQPLATHFCEPVQLQYRRVNMVVEAKYWSSRVCDSWMRSDGPEMPFSGIANSAIDRHSCELNFFIKYSLRFFISYTRPYGHTENVHEPVPPSDKIIVVPLMISHILNSYQLYIYTQRPESLRARKALL